MPPIADGFVLYEGQTHLPGQTGQVAVVVTGARGRSTNRKTGPVAQVWSLPADVDDLLLAVRQGDDGAVCGECPHRPAVNGGCFVNLAWAPLVVWRAWRAGRYAAHTPAQAAQVLAGREVRFGAWGEPCAAPLAAYRPLLGTIAGHTGFTHVWRRLNARRWGWLMASCDSRRSAMRARLTGWRSFRVRLPGQPLLPWERGCPASDEMGHLLNCQQCGQCDGSLLHPRRPSRTILAHGPRGGRHELTQRQIKLF